MLRKLFVLFGLVLILAACGQEAATPTPTAESATAVSANIEVATETAVPTATATATTPPTATLPPPPTTAPPTDTPTPEATATPQPVTLLTADDFGDNRNPLTGEVVTDTAVLQRRPIAIKVSNSPAEYTRPQWGLSQADLVFEHVTEGPITRFTGVFYGQTPPEVGPVRSARLIDLEIPAMYGTALVFSGASSGADGVYNRLAASDFRDRLVRDIAGEVGYFRTDEEEKPWEHRLHVVPEELWQRMDDMGINEPPTLNPLRMAFSSETPEGGTPADSVTLNYRDWTVVEWQYDAENGRYWRSADGEIAIDANNQRRISAANVVIVYAIHQQVVSICESQDGDVCNAHSTEIQIWGQGDAIILRDGQQFPAIWHREKRENMLTFSDEEGNPIPLKIGNTWFQIVPYHYTNVVTIE